MSLALPFSQHHQTSISKELPRRWVVEQDSNVDPDDSLASTQSDRVLKPWANDVSHLIFPRNSMKEAGVSTPSRRLHVRLER
jgi:hypothetical protein